MYLSNPLLKRHLKQSAPHDFQGGNVRTIDTELTQARRSLDRMIAVAQRNRLATLPGLKLNCGMLADG